MVRARAARRRGFESLRCHRHTLSLSLSLELFNQPRSFTNGPTCQVIRAIPRNGVTSLRLGELFGSWFVSPWPRSSGSKKFGLESNERGTPRLSLRTCLLRQHVQARHHREISLASPIFFLSRVFKFIFIQ